MLAAVVVEVRSASERHAAEYLLSWEFWMLDRWSRWVPFTGVVSAVLGIAGAAIQIQAGSPGSDATGAQVIAFYEAHRAGQQVSAFLLTFAFAFLVLFAGCLRAYLRRTAAAEALSAVALAGAVLEAAGQSVGLGMNYALADVPNRLDPAAAQALNVLSNDLVLTNTAGLFVFGIGAGLAVLREARLPSWLGWMAIAMAIVVVTPAEALAFIALLVWLMIVSVLMYVRGGESAQELTAATPHSPPEVMK